MTRELKISFVGILLTIVGIANDKAWLAMVGCLLMLLGAMIK
jgi:hypothetical protein